MDTMLTGGLGTVTNSMANIDSSRPQLHHMATQSINIKSVLNEVVPLRRSVNQLS